MDNSQKIAQTIKEKAGLKNIKLGQMFNDLELSKNTLHNMQTSMPSLETLSKIADYLDMSLDDLTGRQKNNVFADLENRKSIIKEKIDRVPLELLNPFEDLLDAWLARLGDE